MGRTRIGWHGRRTVFALAVVLCAGGIDANATQAAARLTWTPPVHSDSSGHSLTALSCQSVSLCVAVDDGGDVLSSAAPLTDSWSHTLSSDPVPRLNAVSCPSAASCFAVDNVGNLYVGTVPTSASAWMPENIDLFTQLKGISCPSALLCVAVDQAGNVLVSASPGDPLTWSLPMPVDGSNHITAVSCPSASLCAAVDNAGNVLVSTNPTSMRSWQATPLTNHALTAVSCERSALCVAVAGNGSAYATVNVATAPVTWSATPVDQFGSLSAVSCTDVGLCVLLDPAGKAFESDNPTASRPSWAPTLIDPGRAALTAVSCLSAGFCVAADDSGDTLVATLPAPTVATGAGVAALQTAAQLDASVNPNDAMLSDCHFDYGITTAYGAGVPCTVVPRAVGGSRAVVARLGGLSAATTYHFRIAAASGVASADGADAVFTTPAPLKPRPSLSGTPAVGSTLTCWPNVTTTAAETITFGWLSDTAPITAATTASHLVATADETHHLSCQVTVSGDGGSASATSGFDAIPSQAAGEIVESFVGTAKKAATSVSAPVTCSPQAASGCTIRLRLSANRIVHHRRRTVTVGSLTTVLAAGTTRTLSVSLNVTGRRLLRKRHTLAATLNVRGTILGTLTAKLQTDKLVFVQRARKHARPRAR